MLTIKTWDERKQKSVIAGEIINSDFIKHYNDSHVMQMFNGVGIQEDVFQQLVEKNIANVIVHHEDNETWLSASLDTWISNGIVRSFGHGEQRFLSFRFMKDLDQPTLFNDL